MQKKADIAAGGSEKKLSGFIPGNRGEKGAGRGASSPILHKENTFFVIVHFSWGFAGRLFIYRQPYGKCVGRREVCFKKWLWRRKQGNGLAGAD